MQFGAWNNLNKGSMVLPKRIEKVIMRAKLDITIDFPNFHYAGALQRLHCGSKSYENQNSIFQQIQDVVSISIRRLYNISNVSYVIQTSYRRLNEVVCLPGSKRPTYKSEAHYPKFKQCFLEIFTNFFEKLVFRQEKSCNQQN